MWLIWKVLQHKFYPHCTHKNSHFGETLWMPWLWKNLQEALTFDMHMRTHMGENPIIVINREKSFRRSVSLTVHNQIKKRNSVTLESLQCYFHHPLGNMTTNHTREKPHECNQYRKSCCCSFSLPRNKRVLSGENPYEHNECWKTFIYCSFIC